MVAKLLLDPDSESRGAAIIPDLCLFRRAQVGAIQATYQTPSAAPNDNEIEYLSDSGGHGNLWVLNLKREQVRQLTFEQDPNVGLGVPVWSPGVVDSDGTNARRVSAGGGWACWALDGRWLYYSPPTRNSFRIEKTPPEGGPITIVRGQGPQPAVAANGTIYFTQTLAANNGQTDMEIRFCSSREWRVSRPHPSSRSSSTDASVPAYAFSGL